MSRSITICPIGVVEDDILDRIALSIEKLCGVVCRVAPPIPPPDQAFDESRGQYNSYLILKHLFQYLHYSLRLIGVTHLDLYVPILKYVFGLAQIDGPCAVISIHRLRPQFYNEAPDPFLLMTRIEKTVLHELAHSVGLIHCRDWRCVMTSSAKIRDMDRKGKAFCKSCADLFAWHLKRSLQEKGA